MENFYYTCIYDLLASGTSGQVDVPALNRFKAKIVQIHAQRARVAMADSEMADLIRGEQPTLYQCVRKHKRRTSSIVREIQDEGHVHVTPIGIAANFVAFFQKQYSPIDVGLECTDSLMGHIDAHLTTTLDLDLLAPFTREEVRAASRAGNTTPCHAIGRAW
jgi:hypothetical protein